MADVRRTAVSGAVYFTDYRALIKTVRSIDPGIHKQLKKEYKRIAAPMVRDIKDNIPPVWPGPKPPTKGPNRGGGMVTFAGRLSWSITEQQKKPIKSVTMKEKTNIKSAIRSNVKETGLVQLRVNAAPVTLGDMAGRVGEYNRNGYSREYWVYSGTHLIRRKHRLNGQGHKLIMALNDHLGVGNGKSRRIYPSAERKLEATRNEANAALDIFVKEVNIIIRKAN